MLKHLGVLLIFVLFFYVLMLFFGVAPVAIGGLAAVAARQVLS